MHELSVIEWLNNGDVSIRYQTGRDLLGMGDPKMQEKIYVDGWGKRLLDQRKPDGHWGQAFYQPKWISTHYTLLELRLLCPPPQNILIQTSIQTVLDTEKGPDGGIKPIGQYKQSDVCINGMFLNYASYFRANEAQLKSVVDFILSQIMPDGGFNCRSNSTGAVHSSMHTTLSVLEGILSYRRNGYTYRLEELQNAAVSSEAFLLVHHLYKSDKTREIINPRFLRFPYPCRWFYDILRAMDYFQEAGIAYHPGMKDAIDVIIKKRNTSGTWNLASKYAGQTHFDMENAGKPSRWNTLRALRVLKKYNNKL